MKSSSDKRGGSRQNRGMHRGGGLSSLSETVASVTSSIARADDRLDLAWTMAAGQRLSRRANLVRVENNKLLIEVTDENWRRAVLAVRKKVLDRLRSILGAGAPNELEVLVQPYSQHSKVDTNPDSGDGLKAPPTSRSFSVENDRQPTSQRVRKDPSKDTTA